jgi:hypothetical protein
MSTPALTHLVRLCRAFHSVLAWMILAFFLSLAVDGTLKEERAAWSHGPYHLIASHRAMPEQDTAILWAAGTLARNSNLETLYRDDRFQSWKAQHFGNPLVQDKWMYAPAALLTVVPLSYLPLPCAFLAWDGLTLIAAICLLRYARLPWLIIAIGALSPATWRSLVLGQFGVLIGAFLVTGLLLTERHPIKAGILLGLSTIKPQQGLIAPIAWLAARQWRPICIAGATFCALVAASSLIFGLHAWTLFLTDGRRSVSAMLTAPPPNVYINGGLSVFWMCRTLGWGIGHAYMAHIAVAAVAACLTFLAWRKPRIDPITRMAFTCLCSLLISPYGYTSDMFAYSISLAVLLRNNHWRLTLIDVILWLWPFYCIPVTMLSGVLLTPVMVIIAAARAWFHLQTDLRPAISQSPDLARATA